MNVKVLIFGSVVLLVCVIGYLYASDMPTNAPIREESEKVAKPYETASATNRSILPVPNSLPLAASSASSTPAAQTAGDRIAQLSSSSRPVDRMEAYNIADRCWRRRFVEAQNNARVQSERQDISDVLAQFVGACDGVTHAQLDARYENLKIAVAANIRGAAAEFVSAGPFGDPSALSQRPDDPLVLEWKNQSIQYLKVAAEAGDRSAAGALFQVYSNGILTPTDKTQSLAYFMLDQQIAAQAGEPTNPAVLQKIERRFTPEQVSQAIANSQALFNKCCTH